MQFGVAMISSVFYPSIGGAQTHTLGLSQKLQARGISVIVVTRHFQGLARYEEIDGVPTYRVGRGDSSKPVAAISFIVEALSILYTNRHRYDLLHCHLMISPTTIGLLARPLVHKPLVVNPHRSGAIGDVGTLMARRPLLGRMRLAAIRHWGDTFVCISRHIHAELSDLGVPADKLWDITNGVDIDRFRPVSPDERASARAELDLPQVPIVIYSGRLVAEKGVDVLLNAWPTVLGRVPNGQLLLVGDGDQRGALELLAQRLGITNNVIFAGGQSDVARYLQAADAYVLPSWAEGLPVALLEAMACGLSCVATAISGTAQVLTDQVTGRLVKVGDPHALAEGLVAALTQPDAKMWSDQARLHIVNHYSLDAVAERYIQMYEAVLAASPGRRLMVD